MSEKNLIGHVESRKIVTEMEESYLDYAMSVIVQRALPDARDGLKPVHRRILYAMHALGLRHNVKFKKSANVVGEVLGKYHPHGDVAVYDAMVRLAQTFSLRYPMIEGQGNFGSMDGDSAAAMRYTEARLAEIAEEMLIDIEKETVDFVPNYDNSRKEPVVLPSKIPQMLVNGVQGIAVGMATNIPPHNLTEIINASVHLIDHPDATTEDLLQHVTGPDFPTGGIIYGAQEINQAYATGKGKVVIRAKTSIVEDDKGKFQIIVNELPYQVNKAVLIQRIAELVKEDKIDGIKDLRDESDRDGVRVVVELKKDAYPKKVLNQLFKYSSLQTSFSVNALALVEGGRQPRVLNLKSMLEEHIKHREVVITRRTQYDLRKARERAHILEGLKKALDHIDEVIATIKKSKDRETAHANLMKKFALSDLQTTAILDMRLQTLAGLERKKIDDELEEKRKLIKELESILANRTKLLGIIRTEFNEVKAKYGDERRTKVIKKRVDDFSQEDLIQNEEALVMVTKGGYIKRLSPEVYKSQGRGGVGVIGMTTKEEDMVKHLFTTMTLNNILFFTNKGRVFQLPGYEIPAAQTRQAKGQALVNFLQLGPEERVTSVIPIAPLDSDAAKNSKYLAMLTKMGTVKKVKIEDFANVRRSGLIAVKLQDGDELNWVRETSGADSVLIVTAQGQSIYWAEEEVRPMGRNASGVRAIKLASSDVVIGMGVITKGLAKAHILIVTEKGYGKATPVADYRVQGRGGSGVKTAKITAKNGPIVNMQILDEQKEAGDLLIISSAGQVIRLAANTVPRLGRTTQGVRLMRLKSDDTVASVAIVF